MSTIAERNFKWQSWLGADFLCVVFLVVICLSIGLPRFRCGLDFTDEGLLAYGAERVTEGQMPNRDFVSLQPPFSFYTVAAAFKLLGKSLLSLRIFGLIIYVLIPLFVYGIARNVTTKPLALAAAIPTTTLGIPFSYFGPFAAWQGITAALVAAFIYLRAILGGHSLLGLPAGIMTAFSVFLLPFDCDCGSHTGSQAGQGNSDPATKAQACLRMVGHWSISRNFTMYSLLVAGRSVA